MSKPWQDFWTLVFLAAANVYTIFVAIGIVRNNTASERTQVVAALVLLVWIIAVPGLLIGLGVGPDLWQTIIRPFSR
jgi:hypothetical protein